MTENLCDAESSWCPPGARAGDLYKLRVTNLSPTKLAAGKAEVENPAERMLKRIRSVIAQVVDEVKEGNRRALRKVFRDNARNDTLADVLVPRSTLFCGFSRIRWNGVLETYRQPALA